MSDDTYFQLILFTRPNCCDQRARKETFCDSSVDMFRTENLLDFIDALYSKKLVPTIVDDGQRPVEKDSSCVSIFAKLQKKHVSLSILKNYLQRKQEAFAIKLYDLKSSAFFMAKSKATHHSLLTERERFYFIVNGY